MLRFQRNKLVSIHRPDANTFAVHGVLDDDIYGLEVDVIIRIEDLRFLSVRGKWNRHTTPDCPRAIPILSEAEGFEIDEQLTQKLHKTIGRKACRHFANLLVECADAAKEAVKIHRWETARIRQPDLTFEQFVQGQDRAAPKPAAAAPEAVPEASKKETETRGAAVAHTAERRAVPAGGGSTIDLHVHSFPASPCSSASVDDLIDAAKADGLDGICLTDHNFLWEPHRVEDLRQRHGFLILRGNEITTDQGDILVFGLEEDIQGIIRLETLRKKVLDFGGVMIAAHPFRGFLVFGAGELGLTVEKAMDRELFRHVDAIEMLNGKVTRRENRLAEQVAMALNLPMTGGSDAHEASEVGLFATRFTAAIETERDLLDALRSGDHSPVSRKQEP